MDIQDVKDFITARNNGVEPTLSFNQNCMKRLEVNFKDGKVDESHHIEYDHVMVDEKNSNEHYRIAITNHRENISKEELKSRFGIGD